MRGWMGRCALLLLLTGCAALRGSPREGTLEIVHADEFQGTASFEYLLVQPDGTRTRLLDPVRPRDLVTGDRVRVLTEATGRDRIERLAAGPLAATGTRRVAVVILSFADGATSLTPATARTVMDAVGAFYREQSYGRLTMVADIFGPFVLPRTVVRGTCNT